MKAFALGKTGPEPSLAPFELRSSPFWIVAPLQQSKKFERDGT